MKPNPETTKIGRIRMAIGTTFAIIGILTLVFAGIISGFTNLPLTFAGALFLLSGVCIAGSIRLADFVVEMINGR